MNKIYKILLMTVILCSVWTVTSINSQAASKNKSWESVYADFLYEQRIDYDSFVYYVNYGELKIARNSDGIYVKKNNAEYKIKINKTYIGGILTNGREILYQQGKNVYVWKNSKKKKLCTIKSSEVLVGRYGNNVYIGKNIDYDVYQLYRYNIKTKKWTKMDYQNAYYCNGKYLIVGGQFHEGVETTLNLLNMKNGKVTVITNKGGFGHAAIIKDHELYYTEFNERKFIWKYNSINLKTGKKKVLKKNIVSYPGILDRYHYCYTDDEKLYIYDVKKKRVSVENVV